MHTYNLLNTLFFHWSIVVFQELDSKLNDVWIVMDYNTEPSFTREDLKEFVDNLSYEMTQQRRVVYERKSSNEIQSNSYT